jgi:hypothetical protein
MRYYIDCEFDGHNGPLLSIAVVRSDLAEIYIRVLNDASDPWVIDNVLSVMGMHKSQNVQCLPEVAIGSYLRGFIAEDDNPVIIADSPVDIGRFCRAISTGTSGQWSSVNHSLMKFEVHNVDCYPTVLKGAVQHNAWWDAMALRAKLES